MKPRLAVALLPFLGIGLIFAVVIILFFLSASSGDGRESFTDKRECSILQSIEFRNRDRPVSDLEFLDRGDYHIVGIPTEQGKATWVMLNPRSAPYYKQMGENYSLTKEQFGRIISTHHAISTVENCLESHVQRAR